MALTVGNKTNNLTNPGAGTTVTFAHTHNAGADGLLTVCIGHSNAAFQVSSVTYNGVNLTQKYTHVTTSTGMDLEVWELASPATGSNNVVVTLNTGPFNPISTEAISWTGAKTTIGNETFVDTAGPPATGNITVSANSQVVAMGAAGTAGTNVTIDGSSRTIDWNNNANNYIFGGTSASGLTSGSKSLSLNSSAQVAIFAFEIQEQSSTPAAGFNQAVMI